MKLDPADLKDLQPLIAEAVRAALDEVQRDESLLPGSRIGYLEPEAAALLGVRPHVLRDGRQRGLIKAVRLGKSYVYSRQSLIEFVNAAPQERHRPRKK